MDNLQKDRMVEDIDWKSWIYAALDCRKEYHRDTMAEIKANVSNTSSSILIDPNACQSYVSPKIVDVCKLDKVKHEKP